MLGDIRPYTATPRRREEARRRGHVAHSRDLSVVVGLAASLLALRFAAPAAWDVLREMARRGFSDWQTVGEDPSRLVGLTGQAAALGLLALGPVMVATAVATLGAHLLQTGFLLRPPGVRPEGASGFSPGPAMARVFSLDSLVAVVLAGLKLLTLAWAAWGAVQALAAQSGLDALGPAAAVGGGRAIVSLAALACLDYVYRQWQFEQGLRMTRAELEAELRETEGHPITRARRRRVRRPRERGAGHWRQPKR